MFQPQNLYGGFIQYDAFPVVAGELTGEIPALNQVQTHGSGISVVSGQHLDGIGILRGGIRSPEVMEEILAAGTADYFSMSRPLIREPGLPARWQSGDRQRAACISCLGCFGPARKGDGIRCVQA